MKSAKGTDIGNRIKELRGEKKMTQSQLADVLGITQDSISLWEHGKRLPDTYYIILLAKYFEVSSDFLLGLSEDFGLSAPISSAAEKPKISPPESNHSFSPLFYPSLQKSEPKNADEADLLHRYRKLSRKDKLRVSVYIDLLKKKKK